MTDIDRPAVGRTRMRVSVVNRHLSVAVGGSELQCDLVARELAARGHEVTYVAIGGGSATGDAPYAVVPVAPDPDAIAVACRAARADVVYWRFGRRLLAPAERRLSRAGVPLVLAVAHEEDVLRWPRRPLPRAGVRDLLRDVRDRLAHRRSFGVLRRVAGVASQRADQLPDVAAAGVADARVRLVRNLVVLPLGVVPRTHPRPYVAWIGNLKARKRPEVCRDLAAALAPHGVDVLMAGGLQDGSFAALTRPDPAHPNLRHLGRLPADEVAALIAGAVCVAVTYRPEGFSNVLLQAWALGRPTPSLGYDPDGIIGAEGLGGVAGDDLAAFVRSVVALATDPDEAAAAGVRAAAALGHRFDTSETVTALEELLVASVAVAH